MSTTKKIAPPTVGSYPAPVNPAQTAKDVRKGSYKALQQSKSNIYGEGSRLDRERVCKFHMWIQNYSRNELTESKVVIEETTTKK